MRIGPHGDDDWTRLARRMSEISEAPLVHRRLAQPDHHDGDRAKARSLHQKADLRLIVVDYMQLMTSGKKFESRQQEVSKVLRSLKLMAKGTRGSRRCHLSAQPRSGQRTDKEADGLRSA